MASLHDASFYCITTSELPQDEESSSSNLRNIYVKVSVTAACLGIFGAIWQMISWKMCDGQKVSADRRRRLVSPTIAVSLALSNFLSCIGVVARSTGILVTSPPNTTEVSACLIAKEVCKTAYHDIQVKPTVTNDTVIIGTVIEIFTNWMYAASVMWTLAYAIDIYCRIKCCQSHDSKMPYPCIYHVLCWGIPMLTTTGGILAIWIDSSFPGKCAGNTRLLWRYLFSYIPMLIVLFVNPIIYWRAHAVGKTLPRRKGTYTQMEWDVVRMLRVRSFIIVTVYTICWLPNIADSVVQLTVMKKMKQSPDSYKTLFPLWLLEAILNPLQGLFNCILYRQGLLTCLVSGRQRDDRTIQSSVEEHESKLLLCQNQLISNFHPSYT